MAAILAAILDFEKATRAKFHWDA